MKDMKTPQIEESPYKDISTLEYNKARVGALKAMAEMHKDSPEVHKMYETMAKNLEKSLGAYMKQQKDLTAEDFKDVKPPVSRETYEELLQLPPQEFRKLSEELKDEVMRWHNITFQKLRVGDWN